MEERYDEALADLALWMQTWCTTSTPLTERLIADTYTSLPYYEWNHPTPKKRFGITFQSDRQELYMQCLQQFRRIQTMHDGLRWMDIKRWRMTVYRRYISDGTLYDADKGTSTGTAPELIDTLEPDDPRVAIQLPQSVITAGLEKNPR
jgi:hypothetical protein